MKIRSRTYWIDGVGGQNCSCGIDTCNLLVKCSPGQTPKQVAKRANVSLGDIYSHVKFEHERIFDGRRTYVKTIASGTIKSKLVYDDVDVAFVKFRKWRKRNRGRFVVCLKTVTYATGLSRQFILSNFSPKRFAQRGFRYGIYFLKTNEIYKKLNQLYLHDRGVE